MRTLKQNLNESFINEAAQFKKGQYVTFTDEVEGYVRDLGDDGEDIDGVDIPAGERAQVIKFDKKNNELVLDYQDLNDEAGESHFEINLSEYGKSIKITK